MRKYFNFHVKISNSEFFPNYSNPFKLPTYIFIYSLPYCVTKQIKHKDFPYIVVVHTYTEKLTQKEHFRSVLLRKISIFL